MIPRDTCWYREDDAACASAVHSAVETAGLGDNRSSLLSHCARLYGEDDQLGWSSVSVSTPSYDFGESLALNIVANMVDAVRSEVVQARPRPMFLTSGGDFSLQQRAKKLTKFCQGQFSECDVDRYASLAARDAILFGTGVLKTFVEHGRVRVERVMPGELVVGRVDSRYGAPRSIYHVRYLDRAVLAELYPDAADDIATATAGAGRLLAENDGVADLVRVVEAWHLRSGPEADDGRHVISVSSALLFDERYDEDEFPFDFLHWIDPLAGFWGAGLGEKLTGLQLEINRLLRDISRAQKLLGTYRIFLDAASGVPRVGNSDGAIIRYTGQPPVFNVAPAVHPEVYQQLERLYAKAYEIAGVSQLSAQSQKPAGLNSGAALRAYSDQQSKRFVAFQQAYEQMHIGVARKMVSAMRRLAEDDAKYEVVYKSKTSIERISWKDVDLDEESYELDVFPTSMLPSTPAGKLAMLQDLFNAQLIDRDAFLRMADFPDLDAERDILTAPRDLLEQRLERMISEGEYLPPEPFYDLNLSLRITGLTYQRAQLQGVPEERLELLRQYMEDVQALLAPPPPPPAPALPGPAGPPDGPPMGPDGGGEPMPTPDAAAMPMAA